MANTQQVWADIMALVSQYWPDESANPNRDTLRLLANAALAELAEDGDIYETSWSNAVSGGLTLTSATTPLPIDLISISRVEWDGTDNPLPYKTAEWLDEWEAGWRIRTGDPCHYMRNGHELTLDAIPSNATGKLVVRGTSYLPAFSDSEGATNPLTILPYGRQLAIAYYILARRPHDPANEVEVARHMEFGQLWQEQKAACLKTANKRKLQRFRF
jgi:hypothetical protein